MEGNKEMTKEELQKAFVQLSQQYDYLKQEYQKERMQNAFRRLDCLFRVFETRQDVFSAEFKKKCAAEIEDAMYEQPDPSQKE